MNQHVVRIGTNEHSFPLHLLDAETLNTGHVPDMLEIIKQAAKSPFGRNAVEFLCPETDRFVISALTLAVQRLLEYRVPGIRGINIRILSYNDPRLPYSPLNTSKAREAPLVCFSIARLCCLTYAMASANVRYRGMESDYAVWLRNERLVIDREFDSDKTALRELTEHGSWFEAQLSEAGYPWHYPLNIVTPIFHRFVRRCEQLPHVTGHAAHAADSDLHGQLVGDFRI